MTSPMFERVALIGLGLIGSSLSHAMRRGGLARTIVSRKSASVQQEKKSRQMPRPALSASVTVSRSVSPMLR